MVEFRQLARLLREIGLSAEARTEGDAVLTALKLHPTDQQQPQAASPAAHSAQADATYIVRLPLRSERNPQ